MNSTSAKPLQPSPASSGAARLPNIPCAGDDRANKTIAPRAMVRRLSERIYYSMSEKNGIRASVKVRPKDTTRHLQQHHVECRLAVGYHLHDELKPRQTHP